MVSMPSLMQIDRVPWSTPTPSKRAAFAAANQPAQIVKYEYVVLARLIRGFDLIQFRAIEIFALPDGGDDAKLDRAVVQFCDRLLGVIFLIVEAGLLLIDAPGDAADDADDKGMTVTRFELVF